jgi:hypothetical protein
MPQMMLMYDPNQVFRFWAMKNLPLKRISSLDSIKFESKGTRRIWVIRRTHSYEREREGGESSTIERDAY